MPWFRWLSWNLILFLACNDRDPEESTRTPHGHSPVSGQKEGSAPGFVPAANYLPTSPPCRGVWQAAGLLRSSCCKCGWALEGPREGSLSTPETLVAGQALPAASWGMLPVLTRMESRQEPPAECPLQASVCPGEPVPSSLQGHPCWGLTKPASLSLLRPPSTPAASEPHWETEPPPLNPRDRVRGRQLLQSPGNPLPQKAELRFLTMELRRLQEESEKV